MREPKLTEHQIEKALDAMPDWHREGDTIRKTFTFQDFAAAFAWMSRIAKIAEEQDHHPDWRNVYQRVEVCMTTHDSKGLTRLDMEMARCMNEQERVEKE